MVNMALHVPDGKPKMRRENCKKFHQDMFGQRERGGIEGQILTVKFMCKDIQRKSSRAKMKEKNPGLILAD